MDDKSLDILLEQIKLEDIIPSEEVVKKTKLRVKVSSFLKFLTIISFIVNTGLLFAASYIIIIPQINIEFKLLTYFFVVAAFNVQALLIYMNKNQIVDFLVSI